MRETRADPEREADRPSTGRPERRTSGTPSREGTTTAPLHRAVGNQAVQSAARTDTPGSAGHRDDRSAESTPDEYTPPRESGGVDPGGVQTDEPPSTGETCDHCLQRWKAEKPLDRSDYTAPASDPGPLAVSRPTDPAEREADRVRLQRGGFVRFERQVVTREGEFDCRRCGASLSTGHFVQFDTDELGPFGSSCVRKVLGRD